MASHYTQREDSDDNEGQPLLEALNSGPDDAEHGTDAAVRKQLEHTLLRKLDRRNSILVLIYILNCRWFLHIVERV